MADNMVMDWDDTISNDGQEYVLLPEGDYNFTVTKFERGSYPGSAKIPPCKKAGLVLTVETSYGTANINTDLILYRTLEWKLSAFFRSIGQKKHGEELKIDWNKVLGAKGRAHFKPRTYTNKDGVEKQTNNVDKFIDWDEKYFPADTPEMSSLDDDGYLPF